MNYEQISQLIFKEVKKAGYIVEERRSVSTASVYYTLSDGKYSLLFRISDHRTKTNVITLRVDRRLKDKEVTSFVKNRIQDLKRRALKMSLGL